MTDIASVGNFIERAVNIDVQYPVLAIPPQVSGFDVLTVAEIIEIRERLRFNHLIEKSLAFIVDRGQDPRFGYRSVRFHLIEIQVKSFPEFEFGGIPHHIGG